MAFSTETVRERIRSARILRGLSQRALAQVIQGAQCSTWAWETGKVAPSPSSLLKIAQALRVNMLWLTFGEGPMELPKTGVEG